VWTNALPQGTVEWKVQPKTSLLSYFADLIHVQHFIKHQLKRFQEIVIAQLLVAMLATVR
jgi:hypothetical protein